MTSSAVIRAAAASLFALTLGGETLGSQEATGKSSPSVDRIAGWQSDISFWLDKVREQHYVYRNKPLPPRLVAAADSLSRSVAKFSDERMLFEMQRLAAMVGDGHTYVLPLGASRVPGSMLPLRFYLFSDGMYVIDAEPGFERWIGSRLDAIGTTPTSKYMEAMRAAVSADNEHGWKWIGPAFANLRGAIESIAGVSGDSIPVTLTAQDGTSEVLSLRTVPPPPVEGPPRLIPSRLRTSPAPPLWLRSVSKTFWMEDLPDSTLYVQFNQVRNDDGHPLSRYASEMRAHLIGTKPSRIILDVRHNNGGNSYLYPPLIDALLEWEAGDSGRKLYVLMGRNTFSAAQNFISQLDYRTRAIFVGEPSSSKPNFVGEENNFELPWSGAMISISNRSHENIPGDNREWIEPDILVELSSTDYFAGRDPVIEKLTR